MDNRAYETKAFTGPLFVNERVASLAHALGITLQDFREAGVTADAPVTRRVVEQVAARKAARSVA